MEDNKDPSIVKRFAVSNTIVFSVFPLDGDGFITFGTLRDFPVLSSNLLSYVKIAITPSVVTNVKEGKEMQQFLILMLLVKIWTVQSLYCRIC